MAKNGEQEIRGFKPGDKVIVTRKHDGNTGELGTVIPGSWDMRPVGIAVRFDSGSIFVYRPEDLLPVTPVDLDAAAALASRSMSVPQSDNVPQMATKPEPTWSMPVVHADDREISRQTAIEYLQAHGLQTDAMIVAASRGRVELKEGEEVIAFVPTERGAGVQDVLRIQVPDAKPIQLIPGGEGLAAVLMAPRSLVPDELVDDVINVVEADGDVPAALVEAIKLKLRENPSWRPEDEGTREMTESVLRELCGQERHAMADGPHGSVCLRERHTDGSHDWTIITKVPEVEPVPLKAVPDTVEKLRHVPEMIPMTYPDPRAQALAKVEAMLQDVRRMVTQLEKLREELS